MSCLDFEHLLKLSVPHHWLVVIRWTIQPSLRVTSFHGELQHNVLYVYMVYFLRASPISYFFLIIIILYLRVSCSCFKVRSHTR